MKTTIAAVDATGAALVLEDGEIAWPEGRPGAYRAAAAALEAAPDRRARLRPRRRPSRRRTALLEAIAHHAAVALEHGRAVMRGVLAQGDPAGQEQPQTVASLLRRQARAPEVDPSAHSPTRSTGQRDRGRQRVLTEHREDDVDLAELIERLRAMLVEGLVAGKTVRRSSSRSRSPATALPRSRLSSRLFQNALEHGGGTVRIELERRGDDVALAVADDGAGLNGSGDSTASRSCKRSCARSCKGRSS